MTERRADPDTREDRVEAVPAMTDIDSRLVRIETQITESARALQLAATEIERRLTALNHAHEQNLARNAEFVSAEKFDALTERVAAAETALSEARGALIRAKQEAQAQALRVSSAIGVMAVLTAVLLRLAGA